MASSSEETPEERQEAEMEVLRSIYGEDALRDLRQDDAWKVKRPPEFTLRLAPVHDSAGHLDEDSHVVLRVRFSAAYPDAPPDFVGVADCRGVSNEEAAQLADELTARAAASVGEVMVVDLAQHASQWLGERTKKPRYSSFHEEMEANRRERERRDEEERRERAERASREESRQREQIREEVARNLERIEEEKMRVRTEREEAEAEARAATSYRRSSSSGGDAAAAAAARRARSSASESSDPGSASAVSSRSRLSLPSPMRATEQVEFTSRGEAHRLEKLARVGGNRLGGCVYAGLLHPGQRMVAAAEWTFRVKGANKRTKADHLQQDGAGGVPAVALRQHDLSALLKQASSIEQELQSLQKVREHPNVVGYVGMAQVRKPASQIRLVLMEDFVFGTDLSLYLSEGLAMDPALLRFVSEGCLSALAYMHEKNFVHRDLRDTSVFVDNDRRVRVSGFSLDRRIRDLVQEGGGGGDEDDDGSEEDRLFPSAIGRGAKKTDVFRLGLLVLSLALGEVVREPTVPRGAGLDHGLCDFLKKSLNADERERWSAAQLLEHRWIRQRVERSPLKALMTREKRSASPEKEEEEEEEEEKAVPFTQVGSGQSRLQSEFSYIDEIGKGGFGEVMKVKNNLDGQVYAIKKIRLERHSGASKAATRRLIKEVKLLSRLNHENVVRYYTSWIEVTTITKEEEEEDGSDDEEEEESSVQMKKLAPKKKNSVLDDLKMGAFPHGPLVADAVDAGGKSDINISFSSVFPDAAGGASAVDGDEEDDTDDEEDDDAFGTSFLPQSEDFVPRSYDDSDSDIVFENSRTDGGANDGEDDGVDETDGGSSSRTSESRKKKSSDPTAAENKIEIHLMYIQMEYCDKQTLRSAMDSGLYKDTQRVWRMFREIVDGLVHIHTQGMIHRDLKPVNIFIDSRDHVKIGDFGLATTSLINKAAGDNGGIPSVPASVDNSLVEGGTGGTGEDVAAAAGDMTGQIGTALYIAPEINSGGSRTTSYSQKVDLYSLGVIFFEMCYPPLQTGMERIKVLTDLRSPEVKLPSDLDQRLMVQQVHIIRWLLNHDPSKRPNSQELLTSDYLPPPKVEEAELREMVRHTLANTQSASYRHLVDSCLARPCRWRRTSPTTRSTSETSSGAPSRRRKKTLLAHEHVRRVAQSVFQRHGAVSVQLGCSLLPKSKVEQQQQQQANSAGGAGPLPPLPGSSRTRQGAVVEVMTRGGKVVSLPYDLRVAFARFVAKSGISNIKRYCIAPVYREYQIFGYHPREQLECAFDVVTSDTSSASSVSADAEVLFVADELINELQPSSCCKEDNAASMSTSSSSHFFRLSHTLLLRGVLLNCGIRDELHDEVHSVMREAAGWSKAQRTTHLLNLGLSEQTVAAFLAALEHEGPPSSVRGVLRHLIRKNNSASQQIRQALSELEAVISRAQDMGVRCRMVVSPSLVYNPGHFSGMVCQLVRKRKKRRGAASTSGPGLEIVAAGGRYDHLLNKFASTVSLCSQQGAGVAASASAGVGISLSVDRLVTAVAADPESRPVAAEVVLCQEGNPGGRQQSGADMLAGKLWSLGVRCVLCHSSVTGGSSSGRTEEELAKEMRAAYIVVVREAEDVARIRCLEKDRYQEKRVALTEAADHLHKLIQASGGDSQETAATSSSSASSSAQPSSGAQSRQSEASGGVSGAGGGAGFGGGAFFPSSTASSSSLGVQVNYHYRFLDRGKYSAAARKRLEATMSAKMTPLLSRVATGTVIEALALPLPRSAARSVAAFLDLEDDYAAFVAGVRDLVERHPRHRKDLVAICDGIWDIKTSSSSSSAVVFVLYSAEEHSFATLL